MFINDLASIQVGNNTLYIEGSSTASIDIIYPKPYNVIPMVFVSGGHAAKDDIIITSHSLSKTGFTVTMKNGTLSSANVGFRWMSIPLS